MTRLQRAISTIVVLLAAITSAQAQNPVLTIEGACPGNLHVQADGIPTPGITVHLYYSPRRGSYTFPPFTPCYGVEIGLDVRHLWYLGATRADDSGTATWDGAAGPSACGGFLQAMSRICDITNVAQIP